MEKFSENRPKTRDMGSPDRAGAPVQFCCNLEYEVVDELVYFGRSERDFLRVRFFFLGGGLFFYFLSVRYNKFL